ncbi:ADP-ribose pyrophosphatase YjhB, NUDIX family [Halogranum gelatinilyticum]|uniref:ADP-ribose pyrophosphatase YjhB, NUDIX family n=1 Tax=Halogranum gelatinilyticum TaxID=660521 RepID=A0A1G9SRA2_9EURY|nr:NUDIX hydrolase [Halogranum gelatinilyticum]SDM37867.1 ADP-ribose pyrophosphatase YjhB, NUDIX family [Halogranum gelatinilyticum]
MDKPARQALRDDAVEYVDGLVADVEERWGRIPSEGTFVFSAGTDTAFPETLDEFHDRFYPHAAGCVTRDGTGKLLAIRSATRETWESPGGAGEIMEPPEATARREVREETGVVPFLDRPLYTLTMELDFGYDETLPIPVFVFTGEPDEGTVLTPDIVETPEEVADIDWFEPAELPSGFRDRDLLQKHLG